MKKTHKNIAMGGAGISLFIIAAVVLMVLIMAGKPNWPTDIVIKKPYAFATPKGAKTAAAFLIIKNGLPEDDNLIGVRSKISKITELHENILDPDDGKMMMRKIKALDIPSGKKVELTPRGYHVMFIDLYNPLITGETFALDLVFEKAGIKTVSVEIRPTGAKPNAHHNHGYSH